MTTIRNPQRERYAVVDRGLINDRSLSFRAKGVLVWLLDKPDGWWFDSVQLAKEAKEGRDAIRTALKELETGGYLVRTRERDAEGKWVTVTELHETPGQTSDWKSGVGDPTVGTPGAVVNTEPKTENEELSPQPPAEDDVFAAFYAAYPRHVGRKDARRAWDKAVKKARADEILNALADRIRWWKASGTATDKIPHPATWLNGERWLDEIEPVVKPSGSSENPALVAATDQLMDLMEPWFVFPNERSAWWAENQKAVFACVKTALAQHYEFGEVAVRLAIQYRIDRRAMEMPGNANFALCRTPNVSRFKGGVPEIHGLEPTYEALMNRANSLGKWQLR